MLILLTQRCKQDKQEGYRLYNLMTHTGNIGWSIYIDILYSPYSKMVTYCSKKKEKKKEKGGKTDAWMRSVRVGTTPCHITALQL